MYCPNCKSDTLVSRPVKNADVTVDVCRTCKGVWFDPGELENALPHTLREFSMPRDARPGPRVCPHCRKPMQQFQYPDTLVTVDMCDECQGIWLDANESHEIEVVRKGLGHATGEFAEVRGVKGALIRFIADAFETLRTLD